MQAGFELIVYLWCKSRNLSRCEATRQASSKRNAKLRRKKGLICHMHVHLFLLSGSGALVVLSLGFLAFVCVGLLPFRGH